MSAPQDGRSHTVVLAFTLALAGLVFCAAGLAGYDLGTRAVLLAEERWVGGIIWWEVYFGTGFVVGAVHFAKTAELIAPRGR
jgi:hypothetical protein